MELFNYLLKVTACTALFYAFYLLVLRKLTFFKTNRFYLLATLLLSFVIPSLSFTVEREVAEVPIAYVPTETFLEPTLVEQPIISEAVPLAPKIEENFDWYSLLPTLYFAIVACLLCVAFWRLLQLFRHTKKNFDEINGLKIVTKSSGFTNCSFFNYVFIDNENISDAELQVLLKHEAVHAKQFHSADKMLLMLAKAILWFNPIIYLYDKALEQAHEYEADEATSKSFGTEQYASLLLKLAIAKSEMPLVHNFVKSPIKARIKMLFNSKSKNMKKLMYLLALPVGLGLLWGFTVKVVEVNSKPKSEASLIEPRLKLNSHLWGKTLKGKVKSVLQTEVGEVLNFKYGENTLEVFNMAKGKVKPGDEIQVVISGTVDKIEVKDSNGNIIRGLERPVFGMSKLAKLDGKLIYETDTEARLKAQQLESESIVRGQVAKKQNFKTTDTLIGKTFKGIVIGFKKTDKLEILNFQVGKNTIPLSAYNFKGKVKVGDEIEVTIGGSGTPPAPIGDPNRFKNVTAFYIPSKVLGTKGKLIYEIPSYAFLYEANKARYAWSKIKTLDKNNDGTLRSIVLNDKGFTINLNVASQKFKTKDFKVGDSVVVKFFGEKLIAKNTYSTDKMIVLYSWPKKYELKNKALFDRFYYEDGKQKVKELSSYNFSRPKNEEQINLAAKSISPKLLSSTDVRLDTKSDIVYIKNGVMEIGVNNLEADEIAWDKRNEKITAKNGKLKLPGVSTVFERYIIYDLKKDSYVTNRTPGNKIHTNSLAYDLLSKLFADDKSAKISKIMDRVTLGGTIDLTLDGYRITAKVLEAGQNSEKITAHLASLTTKSGVKISGDMIEFDVVSKDYRVIKATGEQYNN